jgi:hypothetical protein
MPVNLQPGVYPQGGYQFPRHYPRILFSTPITLRRCCRGGVKSTHGISLDLGEGGLGAIMQSRSWNDHSSFRSCPALGL